MPRAIDPLLLSANQRSELERWVVALGTPQQVALRCRIILAAAAGKAEMTIAAENGVNRKTVRLWRERFRGGGPQALWEIAPGRGRKVVATPDPAHAGLADPLCQRHGPATPLRVSFGLGLQSGVHHGLDSSGIVTGLKPPRTET